MVTDDMYKMHTLNRKSNVLANATDYRNRKQIMRQHYWQVTGELTKSFETGFQDSEKLFIMGSQRMRWLEGTKRHGQGGREGSLKVVRHSTDNNSGRNSQLHLQVVFLIDDHFQCAVRV